MAARTPGRYRSPAVLADAYVKGRQYPPAIGLYQHVLQQDPKNLLALNNLATLYRQQRPSRAGVPEQS
jgi:Tfp pilus assembly protein PilF